jgi:hypothetical protein
LQIYNSVLRLFVQLQSKKSRSVAAIWILFAALCRPHFALLRGARRRRSLLAEALTPTARGIDFESDLLHHA